MYNVRVRIELCARQENPDHCAFCIDGSFTVKTSLHHAVLNYCCTADRCVLQVNGFGGVAGGGGGGGGGPLASPGGYHSTGFLPELAGACDIMADIQNQLNDLSLTDCDASQSPRYRAAKKPPSTYLCHLCFQKGHFIKDCPQVAYHL